MACFSGVTTGTTWGYTDCCGVLKTGYNAGFGICLDTSQPYSGINVSASSCTVSCAELNATFSITGVCENVGNGAVSIQPSGGVAPYSIYNVVPGIPTYSGAASNGPFVFTGLTGGTYVWQINDSTSPDNQELFVNIIVSDCFCGEIYDVRGTTCNANNGSFWVSGSSTSAPYDIQIYSGNTLYSGYTAASFPYEILNLPSGLYYGSITDSGGSTAQTETVLVSASTELDYGFWVVDASFCVQNQGKLTVTGQTGVGPYTYLWSNGETTKTITGLTAGSYSVTVTDSLGCSTTKSQAVSLTPQLGLGSVTASTPSCFTSNGSLTFNITGGTLPFYYSGSTGQVKYSSSRTFELTGLTTGSYQINVTDADLCKASFGSFISPSGGFDIVDINVTNSSCSSDNGSIQIIIDGTASNNYVYSLTGTTTGVVKTKTTTAQNATFDNLSNDTYQISVSGTGSNCVYSTTKTIASSDKFTVNTNITGTTCGGDNGAIQAVVSTGYTSPLDYVLSDGQQIIDLAFSAYTFDGLSSGVYTLTVTDADNCSVTKSINVTSSSNMEYSLFGTDCVSGNDGSAEVVVTSGNPPFTYLWSNGETGSTISNLSGDTYNVTVTDSDGCAKRKSVTIVCDSNTVTAYSVVGVCNQLFETTTNTKRNMKKMLNEGFLDVTSGRTNCVLNTAEFSAVVSITGSTGWVSGDTVPFYTATTLNSVPTDSEWINTVESILNTINEVGSVTIDLLNNTIIIKSDCDGDSDPLQGARISIKLQIPYDVNCVT